MIEIQTKNNREIGIVNSFNIDDETNELINIMIEKGLYVSKGNLIRISLYEFIKKNNKISQEKRKKRNVLKEIKENLEYINRNKQVLKEIENNKDRSTKTTLIDKYEKLYLSDLKSTIFTSISEYANIVLRRFMIKKYIGKEFKETDIISGSDYVEIKINGEFKKFKIIKK